MKNNKAKNILSSLLLVFSLASCNNGNISSSSSSSSSSSPESSESSSQNTPSSSESSSSQTSSSEEANQPPGPNPGDGENQGSGSGENGGNDQPGGGNDQPGGNEQQGSGSGSDIGGGGAFGGGGTEADVNFPEYSTLPVINVTTAIDETTNEHQTIESKEVYTDCSVSVENCDEAYQLSELKAGIRLRGNTTSQFIKKPYRIKFSKKQNLLGMNDGNKYKSWVLLADWNDNTYSRNYLSLHLGDMMDSMEFSSDSKHVELYLNGSYRGIYLLAEQIQVGPGRVDVDESGVDDETITDTGFLLELEASTSRREAEGVENDAWIRIDEYAKKGTIDDTYKVADNSVAYYVIKSDARSEAQVAYIKDYMTQIYDAIYKSKDRETIESLIDIDTAVDMLIMQMIGNDVDGNYSSIYVYKDKGGKLKFGPPWDFDNNYSGGSNATTLYHILNDLYTNYSWFKEATNAKMKEYLKTGGIVDQCLQLTKEEVVTHRDAILTREYVKWRSSSTALDTNYNEFENWIKNHKKWLSSTYNVTFE